ncbi:glyoxalase [Streptomyces sp. OF3]|uniref:Glyoxalase n=3 Tax=Streptomyces alkaliterrae TaxID=2213162 RepID=A0A7W3ZQA2_9ACTN|nr:glyoxalase [Streptomyces alkaliterrae]MBB1256377.1 glyoxalase [Streptomyces alkaliterrae]MBB1259959.1 glyoxalase [Streptomyces alkaliterrae]
MTTRTAADHAPARAFTIGPLHHVQLSVPTGSEDRCRAYWSGVLGLSEIEKPPVLAARGGCWFRGDGIEVHLGAEADFVPARRAHPGVLVTSLDALADRLLAHGLPVTWDDNLPGYRRFHSADPFGNRLEFLEPAAPAAPAAAAA